MITTHGTALDSFQTDSNYWDCECPDNEPYIHSILKGNFCPKCNQHADNDCRPESRVSEIAKLYIEVKDNAIIRK